MIKQRIETLRALMARENISVYIVTSADYNASAYVGEYFKTRQFMTGFTGSNGTLIVTLSQAVLYTDSRYYIQADKQLNGSGIELYKADEKETVPMLDFIAQNVEEKGVAAVDGRTLNASFAKKLVKKLDAKKAKLVFDTDLVSKIWTVGREKMPDSKAYIHGIEFAGESAAKKLEWLRLEMKKSGCDIHLISTLDDIAWLLNIRGSDIHCLPAVLSYAVITQTEIILFIDEIKLTDEVKTYFSDLNITVKPYGFVYEYLETYNGGEGNMLLDSQRVNYSLYGAAKKRFNIIDKINPVTLRKAVKNETEVKNARKAHISDGKAVCEFIAFLKNKVKSGESISETEAGEILSEYRKKAGAVEDSFNAICGYADHGAIVHYSAAKETDRQIKNKGLLLLDSGGQYKEGTTDVTRTLIMGETTSLERKCYTLVLKGMLALADARFKKGTTGANLDVLARLPLWQHGFDYGHSTGHGVGSCLSVHEAPNGFSGKNNTVFEAGMITSDEPGIYIEGKFGVRIENLILCREDGDGFLSFEFLTMVPIDKEGLDMSLMTSEDIERLNRYHKKVRENILPIISDEARAYLLEATEEI